MNKTCYRTIFNKARGLLMAVAETAASHGKACGEASPQTSALSSASARPLTAVVRPLTFSLWALLGMAWLPAAHAQIVADPNAPGNQRPTVLAAPNGVPVVNIQTPSAAGVSRNTYSQFDVNAQGAILNNARTNAQTLLGGWVQANPWLAGGAARVILNEINASNPSQLRGFVEVAGSRAEVIIANPAGVNINGGGFINASRATITAGTPVMNGGNLEGYVVQKGLVTINGAGLDGSQTDFTGIIARAVEVNAGIWANELKVTTGANQVDVAQTSATPIAGNGAAPAFALDVSQIGGMYAGKITLVGTEAGLGVRNAGTLGATAGQVVVTVDGMLQNSGRIAGSSATRLDASGGIDNTASGTIYAAGDTHLSTRGSISNAGLIAAQGNATLAATGANSQVSSAAGSVLAAGLREDGTLAASGSGKLAISATQALAAHGHNMAAGNVAFSGTQLDLTGSQTSGSNVALTASSGSVSTNQAAVFTPGLLAITASTQNNQTLTNNQGTLSAGQLQLEVANLSNVRGNIVQTGSGDTSIALTSPSAMLDNTSGRIAVNSRHLAVSGTTLVNTDGRIEHAGTGSLEIRASTLDDQRGQITSNGHLSVIADHFDHQHGSTQAEKITLTTTNFDNRQGQVIQLGLGQTHVNVAKTLDNRGGQIISNGDTTIGAHSTLNQGGLLHTTGTSNLSLSNAATLDNSAAGKIAAGGHVVLTANTMRNNQGEITANGTLNATVTQAFENIQGLVAANGEVDLSAASLDNTKGTLASVLGKLTVATAGVTRNDSGKIQAAGDIALRNAGLSNTQATPQDNAGSVVGHNVLVNTDGQALNNQWGTIAATQDLSLQTGALDNDAGLIQAGTALVIDTHGQALINTRASAHAALNPASSGGITSGGTAHLRTGTLNNAGGYVGGVGATSVNSGQVDNTAGGQFVSQSWLGLTNTGLNNQGGQIQALGDIALNAGLGGINNQASLIRSGGSITLAAATVDNRNTLGTDQGIEGYNIAVSTTSLDNRQGAMRADGDITIGSSGSINNSLGLMSAGSTLSIQDEAPVRSLAITNTGGTFIAGLNTTLRAASLAGGGRVLSKQDLSIDLTRDYLNAAGGEVAANRNATLTTTGDITNAGTLQAGGVLTVNAKTIDNTVNGDIHANTTRVTATDTLTNRGVIDGVHTELNAGTLNNLGTGRIYGDGLSIGAGRVNNGAEMVNGTSKGATIAARSRLDIGASVIDNSEGALIFSAGDMRLGGHLDSDRSASGQAAALNNASATIEALGNLSLNVGQLNNRNNHFSTQLVEISSTNKQQWVSAAPISDPQRLPAVTGIKWEAADVIIARSSGDDMDYMVSPDGQTDHFLRYDYTRTVSETQVATSDPGKILAGGNIHLQAGSVLNDNSHIIAGATLNVAAASLVNTEVQGQRTTTDSGTVSEYWRVERRGRDRQGLSQSTYAPPATVEAMTLTATRLDSNTSPGGTGTTVSNAVTGSVSANTSAAGTAEASVNVASTASVNPVIRVALVSPSGGMQVVRAVMVNVALPNASLFSNNLSPTSSYLVETDPRFSNYKTWLGSDYLLGQLQFDPAVTQKRLGDGFYEQRLIREQVAQLTGQRFLAGYSSDEEQYKALMDAGVTYAQQYQLRPGIALSPQQMAQLTSDIVWLVEQEVTLADGSRQKVLVPQLYVRTQDGDLDGSGALLAGKAVNLNLSGDLINSGTIAGRNVVNMNADNIHNLGGRINSDAVSVSARNDLNNLGGTISANTSLIATAGRDINIESTTRSATSTAGANSFSQTYIDRVAGLYVSNPGGVLVASAGRDTNIIAGVISNAGQDGITHITAGRDLNLGVVSTGDSSTIVWNAANRVSDASTQEVGSQIRAVGEVSLQAGNNLTARAAAVEAGGALLAVAGNNVSITAGTSSQSVEQDFQHSSRGFLSKKTVTTHDTVDRTDSVGSSFSGNTVTLLAGKDIGIQGSSVVSDNGTTLVAGNNINIEAAQNTYASTSLRDDKKSGIFSGGGLGVTIGKQQQSTDQKNTRTTAAASTVGSIGGNVTIQAGEAYKQVGSDVLAPGGDISISAKQVDIIEARETSRSVTEQKFRQSGLTVAITSPVISAVQTMQQMSQAAGDTSDGRMKLLAAANAGLAANNAANAVKAGQSSSMNGKDGQVATGGKNPDGTPASRDANAADQVGGINLSLSIGSSKSQSNSTSQSDTARGSSVAAGGNIAIVATGAGQDSNLTIQGSTVEAGKSALLFADNQIKLLAAQNTASQASTNSSSSGSIGASFGTNGGISFNISANKGQGQGNGSDETYTNTQVKGGGSAGGTVILQSGGDTTLQGAVVAANQVKADVGGNLYIESLQDKSNYASQQSSSGASLSVSITGVPTGGGISASKSNIDSNYQSVTQQSGIKTGDGGFQVDVAGNTDLKGAVIASTDKAVNNASNSFTTGGTLSTSDIQNSASYSGKSTGLSINVGQQAGKYGVDGVGVGIGSDKGDASSTTTSGISGIAANTAVRSTDPETGIARIFDADKVQREINAQMVITQAFSKEAPKAVASYAASQAAELRRQGNEEEAKKWDENGSYRIALHVATGALGGGASGAAGAAASASAANLMNELQDSIQQSLLAAGLGESAAKVIAQGVAGLTAAGVGAAVGGMQGAATAATVDLNNRQLHPTEAKVIKDNAARFAKQIYGTDNPTPEQVEAAIALLANTAQNLLDNNMGVIVPYSSEADTFLQTLKIEYMQQNGSLNLPGTSSQQQLFYATVEQKNQPWLNQGLTDPAVTGIIVKTPLAPVINNPTNDPSRDRMTGLPLDENGRYTVRIELGDPINGYTVHNPKFTSCATADCVSVGANLDRSDPDTQAYLKALDVHILKGINTGVTGAAFLTPLGAVGTLLAALGPMTSVVAGGLEGKAGAVIAKEALQAVATKYIAAVYRVTEATAIRITSMVDLAGGWQAFIDRSVESTKDTNK